MRDLRLTDKEKKSSMTLGSITAINAVERLKSKRPLKGVVPEGTRITPGFLAGAVIGGFSAGALALFDASPLGKRYEEKIVNKILEDNSRAINDELSKLPKE